MKIDHEFVVPADVDRAWAVLTDLELIAPCLPGAVLTGSDGDTYSGKLKVKVGPVVSEFAGTATFVEKDDVAHVAVIDAKARDARGAGNASATITARLRADGDTTVATVETDMKISGKLAQFGSGMIKEVSAKLIASFVTCLEGKIAAADTSAPAASALAEPLPGEADAALVAADSTAAGPTAYPAVAPAPVATAAVSTAPAPAASTVAAAEPAPAASPAPAATAPTTPVAAPAEPEALDLFELAGNSVAKRVVPVVVGVAAVVAVVVIVLTTR